MPKFSMPMYEFKFNMEDDWKEISDLEIMDELYKTYNRITPAIKKMITGQEIITPHGIFRLNLKGGDQESIQS